MKGWNFNLPMNCTSATCDLAEQVLRLPVPATRLRPVALQSKNAHTLCVSEFQFGGEFVHV
jgi:hypothetical protein